MNQNLFIKPADLKLALKLLRKNALIIIGLLLVFCSYQYFQWYVTPNVFKVSADVLYKSSSNEASAIAPGMNYLAGYQNQEQKNNQEKILKSHDLIADVIGRLDFEQTYIIEGRLRESERYNKAFSVETIRLAEEYNPNKFKFLFGQKNIIVTLYSGNTKVIKEFPYSLELKDEEVHFVLKTSSNSLEPLRLLQVEETSIVIKNKSTEALIKEFRSKVGLKTQQGNSVFNISINELVPEKAIVFLDTLINLYRDYTIKERLDQNAKTIVFIDKQLSEVANIINENEIELDKYKRSESIFNVGKEESRFFEKFLTLDENIQTADLKVKQLKQLQAYISKNSDENVLPPAGYIPDNDPYLSKTMDQLYELHVEISTDLYEVSAKNPRITRQDSAFKTLSQDIIKYINSSIKFLEDQKKVALRKQRDYEVYLRDVPQTQREILNMNRKIQINEKLYNYLLERRANMVIERSSISPDVEVIDSPRVVGIQTSSKNDHINIGILYGLVLSVVIVFLRFFFFDKIEDLQELKFVFPHTLAGGLPKFNPITGPKDADFLKSEQAEAFRRIRTNLQFLGLSNEKGSSVMLVTSMFPSEGKTFTASNLAHLFAYSGKKVLLVDVDLHKPKMHKELNLPNNRGISLVLAGSKSFESQIQSNVIDNLDVVTTGPYPPNASELILNGDIEKVIANVKEGYDIVIMDTPPLHLITDAQVLMKFSDINLIVLNTKHASRTTIKDVSDVFEKPVKGSTALIFNEITVPVFMRYYGKYNYKYAYKYGYGAYTDYTSKL